MNTYNYNPSEKPYTVA